jgi:HK97 family phage major capsid protein
MTMPATKELRERRLSVWEDMKALLEESQSEGMNAEQSAKYNEMEGEERRLRDDIDARERAAKIEAALEKPQEAPEGIMRADVKPYENEQRTYARAFDKWIRGGSQDLSREERQTLQKGKVEQRDMGVAIGSAGGYLVPDSFSNAIYEHMKWYGAVRSVADVITTGDGGDMLYPHMDDTGNVGAILAEGGAISEQDVTIGARTIKSWLYTSKLVQVSWQLQQDSYFDVAGLLAKVFGERLGRIQNTHFTTGVGATQPEGFVTNAPVTSTATNDTTVIDDMVTLVYSLDRAYRPRASFQMHDAIIAHLRKEQGSDGAFIWQPSAQAGEPDRLLGYPVIPNNDMASTPTTDAAKIAAFGDFSSYLIRDVKGISVVQLNERYADNLQTGFFAYLRTEGQPKYKPGTTTSAPIQVMDVN